MELSRLGAKITIKNRTAKIEGNTNFIAAEVMSSDLRASAALVLSGIVSKGNTIVTRIYHCDRGYENFENKLKKIGVKIKRFKKGMASDVTDDTEPKNIDRKSVV